MSSAILADGRTSIRRLRWRPSADELLAAQEWELRGFDLQRDREVRP
jgi:hypothetical protein